jgi:hypothetical protein
MPDITISITDTENKALEYVTSDIQGWADNALTNRARIGIDEICTKLMAHCNENEIAMAVGKDAQVTQAFELNVVQTAAEIEAADSDGAP